MGSDGRGAGCSFFEYVLQLIIYPAGFLVVGAFVLAAIVTPPDVLSQCLLALPLVILYQVGIWLCAVFGKKDEPEEESAESS